MGTGKTWVLIEWIKENLRNGVNVLPVLIVAPKSVCHTWENELVRFGEGLSFTVAYDGSVSERREIVKSVLSDDEFDVLIINYEMLTRMPPTIGASTVILDESTRIKNTKAARSKAAYRIGRYAKYKWILTGSPIPRGVEDIYGQIYFLDAGTLLGKNYWAFLQRYFSPVPIGPGRRMWKISATGTKQIKQRVAPLIFQRDRKECLRLPEKIYSRRMVEMHEEIKRYQTRVLEYWRLEDKETNSRLAVDAWLRMLASGHTGDWSPIACNKYASCLELVDDIDSSESVVIWTNFIKENKRLVDTLVSAGHSVVSIIGEVTQDARTDALRKFESRESRICVISEQCGAFGLNELRNANFVVYFSNGYDLELRMQSEDRTFRAGREVPCNYIDLITTGTIEQHILDLLETKNQMSESFFRAEVLRRMGLCGNI
jgi:SNF2 family DNA or RNA helicase